MPVKIVLRWLTILLILGLGFAWAETPEGLFTAKGAFDAGRFIAPDTCGECHADLYAQWHNSVHALALQDPVYQGVARRLYADTRKETERREGEMCIKCHAPAAFGGGLLTDPSQDFAAVAGPTSHGVFCDFCHAVTGQREAQNTAFYVLPGQGEADPGVKRGPRDDPAPEYHDSAYSALHTDSRFCAGCHEVRHIVYDTPLETTYQEWRDGPYSTGDPQTTVHCQDCHLRQSPGVPATGKTARPAYPGASADGGPRRPHIWRHALVGANAFLPALFGAGDERRQMALERLQNCASLSLTVARDASSGPARLTVRVDNDGAGHALPTGVTELRQVWLEITVLDARGNSIFSSGVAGSDGALPPDTRLYHTQLGDADGRPPTNILQADRVLYDYRIPAGGYRLETYPFSLPAAARGELTITARLLYRGLPPEILALLGEKAPDVPVIEMARKTVSWSPQGK